MMQENGEKISGNEFMIALPSMMIGVAVLSLPSDLAKVTLFSDGWLSIVLGGVIFTFFTILGAKIVSLFAGEQFLTYTSFLVSKPVAIVLTIVNVCIGLFLSAYSVRSVAYISQQSFFEQTPMEVLALCFLLVVIYAVSGSRVGIFRLNVLFFPIIMITFFLISIFNIQWFDMNNIFPLFKSNPRDYWQGIVKTYDVFIGFGIILFYACIIKKSQHLTKKIVIGISISVLFYLVLFILTIGVFGNAVTQNLSYPMIELAKRVDIPGGIFERIEALFFAIWMMTIFNTASLALDIAVLLLNSIFTKINKKILTFLLSPIVYYLAMFPQQLDQINIIASIASQVTVYFTCTIIVLLFIAAKFKGVYHHEKN